MAKAFHLMYHQYYMRLLPVEYLQREEKTQTDLQHIYWPPHNFTHKHIKPDTF